MAFYQLRSKSLLLLLRSPYKVDVRIKWDLAYEGDQFRAAFMVGPQLALASFPKD